MNRVTTAAQPSGSHVPPKTAWLRFLIAAVVLCAAMIGGSLAMFAAIRRASSLVSSFAAKTDFSGRL